MEPPDDVVLRFRVSLHPTYKYLCRSGGTQWKTRRFCWVFRFTPPNLLFLGIFSRRSGGEREWFSARPCICWVLRFTPSQPTFLGHFPVGRVERSFGKIPKSYLLGSVLSTPPQPTFLGIFS